MKKTVLAHILFLVIFSTFLSGCTSDNANIYNQNSEQKNKSIDILTTYHNDEYGYSFDIPKQWEGKYEILEKKNKTHFLYTECPGQKDVFLTIIAWTLDEFKELEKEHLIADHILAKTDNYVFYFNTPIALPYDSAEKEKKYGEDFSSMIPDNQTAKNLFHI